MAWDYADYVEYIKRNAPPGVRGNLLKAASTRYSAKHPNIHIVYYSMPDWLDIFSFGPHNNARRPESISLPASRTLVDVKPFATVAHAYQFAAQKYQKKVAGILDTIAGLGTGKALLHEIDATGRTLRIMPHWHWQRVILPGPVNATPRATRPGQTFEHVSDGMVSNTADTYAKGAHVLDENQQPTDEIGTGKGANVVLFYSPEDWEVDRESSGPGFAPDEVMFHEMVHITRQFRGLAAGVAVDGGGGYGNEEEYLATVLANLYLSEKGKDLRGAYSYDKPQPHTDVTVGGNFILRVIDPPPKNWSVMKDPDTFLQNRDKTSMTPRELLQRFSARQKAFYGALAQLPDGKPKFNPVKQFFRENQRPDI